MVEKKPLKPISDYLARMILQSPFHMLIGEKTALIEFTSRQSGRIACQTIRYLRKGNYIQALCKRGKDWWKNIKDGAPVKLVLDGKKYQGWAEVIEGPDKIIKEWRIFVRSLSGGGLMGKESGNGKKIDENLPEDNQFDSSVLVTIQLS